jgi:hypothetical protein
MDLVGSAQRDVAAELGMQIPEPQDRIAYA